MYLSDEDETVMKRILLLLSSVVLLIVAACGDPSAASVASGNEQRSDVGSSASNGVPPNQTASVNNPNADQQDENAGTRSATEAADSTAQAEDDTSAMDTLSASDSGATGNSESDMVVEGERLTASQSQAATFQFEISGAVEDAIDSNAAQAQVVSGSASGTTSTSLIFVNNSGMGNAVTLTFANVEIEPGTYELQGMTTAAADGVSAGYTGADSSVWIANGGTLTLDSVEPYNGTVQFTATGTEGGNDEITVSGTFTDVSSIGGSESMGDGGDTQTGEDPNNAGNATNDSNANNSNTLGGESMGG
jgi:hypothetical protein